MPREGYRGVCEDGTEIGSPLHPKLGCFLLLKITADPYGGYGESKRSMVA